MTIARQHRRAALTGLLAALTATTLVVAGCGTDANGGGSSSSGSSSSGSSSTIQIWEGWTGQEAKTFSHLVSEYEAQHPGQKVQPLFVNNDDTLQKVLTAVKAAARPTSPTSTAPGRPTWRRSPRSST